MGWSVENFLGVAEPFLWKIIFYDQRRPGANSPIIAAEEFHGVGPVVVVVVGDESQAELGEPAFVDVVASRDIQDGAVPIEDGRRSECCNANLARSGLEVGDRQSDGAEGWF